jgi:hypothetical protein
MTALSNEGNANSPLFDLDPDALTRIPVRLSFHFWRINE